MNPSSKARRILALSLNLAAGLMLTSCQLGALPSPQLEPEDSKIATDFASALLGGDYNLAHSFLTPELQQHFSAEELGQEFHAMYSGYAEGKPTHIVFDPRSTMTDWPDKHPNDVGWAYVSIVGDDFVEAVAVVITEFEGDLLISEIEWGRP